MHATQCTVQIIIMASLSFFHFSVEIVKSENEIKVRKYRRYQYSTYVRKIPIHTVISRSLRYGTYEFSLGQFWYQSKKNHLVASMQGVTYPLPCSCFLQLAEDEVQPIQVYGNRALYFLHYAGFHRSCDSHVFQLMLMFVMINVIHKLHPIFQPRKYFCTRHSYSTKNHVAHTHKIVSVLRCFVTNIAEAA